MNNEIILKKRKKRKVYQFKDLKPCNIKILQSICFAEKDYFVCPGNSYYKLKGLNLITNEYKITTDGINLLRELYDKMKRKKK